MPGKAHNSARKSCLFCCVLPLAPPSSHSTCILVKVSTSQPCVGTPCWTGQKAVALKFISASAQVPHRRPHLPFSYHVPVHHQLSKTLPHLLEMCITQKRCDTLEWHFQLQRFPLSAGKIFWGTHYQNSVPVFVFSCWGLSGCHQAPTPAGFSRNPITILPQTLLDQSVFASYLPSSSLLTAFPGLTYFSVTFLSPPSPFPPKHPFFPRFSQQQPLSPCQLGASAWEPLLTEVTGVTYNYMAMDYGALFIIQIPAFLKWQNIINSKFCLQ